MGKTQAALTTPAAPGRGLTFPLEINPGGKKQLAAGCIGYAGRVGPRLSHQPRPDKKIELKGATLGRLSTLPVQTLVAQGLYMSS